MHLNYSKDAVVRRCSRPLRHIMIITALATLCACGGGGSDGALSGTTSTGGTGATGTGGSTTTQWVAGNFQPSSHYQAQCAAPRTGSDPITGDPYPDMSGSKLTENNWLRSWSNELYLWYDEIVDQDPNLFSTPDYFNQLKTTALDANGEPKDKFHFTYTTAQWESLSTTDTEPGYGLLWALLAASPPRSLLVAYTMPNSPASTDAANLVRGTKVISIDGVDVENGSDVATLNAGLTPATVGETHTFVVQDPGSTSTRTVTLQSANVTENPVPEVATISTSSGPVGYMLFNDHLATAEAALIGAVNTLKAANVTDLVIDIRYNGGGLLDVASELAYMVAGPAATAGQIFDGIQFNSKNPSTNPVTGGPIVPESFPTSAVGFSAPKGEALPTLNLARVFVLTGSLTCSASEAVMNGLRGVGVEVIQIGTTTCGKPYGFYPQDNCGTTYFSIEFRSVNAKGFGDYADGFSPPNSLVNSGAGATLPGCNIEDDFTHPLGNTSEHLLAGALSYRVNQVCLAPMGGTDAPAAQKHAVRNFWARDAISVRSPLRQNLLLRKH